MRVAIQGCSHGELDSIYRSILALDRQQRKRTDVVLLCGDFQAVRNVADLSCIAMPDKYKRLGDFHHYYSGKRQAPYLTLVIGGNHEASNHFWELFHGGWLAPNIYYVGAAGCVEVGGLRIAGISGIYKKFDYNAGRFEQVPYDNSTVRSTYHTRAYDVVRLKLLNEAKSKPQIVLSHDWPNTIEAHGDTQALIRKKPFFKEEIQTKTLGSPPLMELLRFLEPLYWFSAHLHVRFAALYKHDGSSTRVDSARGGGGKQAQGTAADAPAEVAVEAEGETQVEEDLADDPRLEEEEVAQEPQRQAHWGPRAKLNPEQINIELSPSPSPEPEPETEAEAGRTGAAPIEVDEEPPHEHLHAHAGEEKEKAEPRVEQVLSAEKGATRFLALSKCLPNQDFLQILDIDAPFDTDDAYSIKLPSPPSAPPTGPKADQPSSAAAAQDPSRLPTFRHVPRWLAITRALHPLLALQKHQPALPDASDASVLRSIEKEEEWVRENLIKKAEERNAAAAEVQKAQGQEGQGMGGDLHPLAIARVQMFMPTAPATDGPAGSAPGPPPWYTNPQTVSLCAWLGLQNKINAPPSSSAPSVPGAASAPPGALGAGPQGIKRPRDSFGSTSAAAAPHAQAQQQSTTDEAAEISLIQAAARKAMLARKRAKGEAVEPEPEPDAQPQVQQGEEMVISEDEGSPVAEEEEVDEALKEVVPLEGEREVMTLSDEDEDMVTRWKEGTG